MSDVCRVFPNECRVWRHFQKLSIEKLYARSYGNSLKPCTPVTRRRRIFSLSHGLIFRRSASLSSPSTSPEGLYQ
jgi:hypothetical protein